MFYRIGQFIKALFPMISTAELHWVKQTLPPRAFQLFLHQDRGVQRHALDVAHKLNRSLLISGELSPVETNTLMIAALLHDCGKSSVRVRIWHRVFIVLSQGLPLSWQHRLERKHSVLSFPFRIAREHALWGDRLAQQAGVAPEVCRLIAEHHHPTTRLGQLLKEADELC